MTKGFIIDDQLNPNTTTTRVEYHHLHDEIDEFFENFDEVDPNTANCLPFPGNNVVIVDGEPLEEKLGLNLLDQSKSNKRSFRTVQHVDSELTNGSGKKQIIENEEKKAARRKREAEAKKRRRQNETPEQRQHRLALHAERMRKTRANKSQNNQAQQPPPQQSQQYYEVAHPSAHNQTPEYATATPVQIVAMPPPHQTNYHQPAPHYRQTHQQPTIITVPIPASNVAGNGPLTIHVTLPENLHLANQSGQPQPVAQLSQQVHLVPAQRNSGGNSSQYIVTQDQYGNPQPMHVIQIQTQPSPANHSAASGQPQHIIIQPQQHTVTPQSSRQINNSGSSSSQSRPVPHRFRNLTDEQIARRRKANAERSRRRRAMETPEQRAERNRRTAERMRQRRAKIAEERGIVRAEPRTSTLSAARFEEIFQSVVKTNMDDIDKDNSKDMNHMGDPMNGQPQHIIVSSSHQIPQQQVVIAQSSQNNVYHPDGQAYLYQPAQNQGHVSQPQQRIIVQQTVPTQQMNRI